MIALALLLLLGIYLGLFVLAGLKTKTWAARVLSWFILLAPVLALTWDMPVGYQRYKALCAAEGGLRVYEKNPPLAKVIRLDAADFFAADARSLLAGYPTMDSVETRDEHFSGARPRAYARYERNPQSPIPTKGPRDEFKPLVTSLDKVEERPGGQVTIAAGISRADYILSKEYEAKPIRLSITRQWLRRADGTPVASTTSIVFSWTNAANTIFGKTAAEYCGDIPGQPDVNGKALLALIARPTTN
jgi:hypothetical protein